MDLIVEWAFEGDLKCMQIRNRRVPDPLSAGVYVSTCKRTVKLLKLSGTAIIQILPPQSGRIEAVFVYFRDNILL